MIRYWWDGYRKIFTYSGRASRRAFSSFVLCQFVLIIAFFILLFGWLDCSEEIAAFILLFMMAVHLLALISYSVRRCHDFDTSGYFCFFYLLLGGILTIILMFIAPTPGRNKYGPDPRNLPDQKHNERSRSIENMTTPHNKEQAREKNPHEQQKTVSRRPPKL